MLESELGVKVVTVKSAEPIPSSLGKPRKKSAPAHMKAWRPLDVNAELESLETDYTVKEAVIMSRKVPAEKFGEYLAAWRLEVAASGKNYPNRAEFRAHFFSFCAARWRAEQAKNVANAANAKRTGASEVFAADKFAPGVTIIRR